jgi:hypothetical protein
MMWPEFLTKYSDFRARRLNILRKKTSQGIYQGEPMVSEECRVCESLEDHIHVEVCCDIESTYVFDQWEEQFCVWEAVSVLSSQP